MPGHATERVQSFGAADQLSLGRTLGTEKRTLLDELVPAVNIDADHLDVDVRGAPTLDIALHEVGLRNRTGENDLVGGPMRGTEIS